MPHRKAEMEMGLYLEPGERCLFPMSPDMRYAKTEDSKLAAEMHRRSFLDHAPNDLGQSGCSISPVSRCRAVYLPSFPISCYLIAVTAFESTQDVGRFVDVAPKVGLGIVSDAGGIIVDDFENRGLFDVVLSEMGDQDPNEPLRYFRNNGGGTFSNQ